MVQHQRIGFGCFNPECVSVLWSPRRVNKTDDSAWIVGNPEVMPPIFRKIQAAAVGGTGSSVPVLFQFANPNIAIADRVIVVLQGTAIR